MNTFSDQIVKFKNVFMINRKIIFSRPNELTIQTIDLQVNFFSAIDERLIDF